MAVRMAAVKPTPNAIFSDWDSPSLPLLEFEVGVVAGGRVDVIRTSEGDEIVVLGEAGHSRPLQSLYFIVRHQA